MYKKKSFSNDFAKSCGAESDILNCWTLQSSPSQEIKTLLLCSLSFILYLWL